MDLEHAILLDVNVDNQEERYEFVFLLKTAKIEPVKFFSQNIDTISKGFYVGKGKLLEIKEFYENYVQNSDENNKIDYLVCNFDLSPVQRKNIESITSIPVIDRTSLILRIFEMNAKTKEAKLQVEIAKIEYLKTQLIDGKASFAQVKGGSFRSRGPGEKQIEISRRSLDQYSLIKHRQLEEIRSSRKNMRTLRLKSTIPNIVVVGYTNSGKSTLMNLLMDYSKKDESKNVYAKDELFATLETSTRLISSYRYPSFIITDTVGFIDNLPISLIKAFRSTLEEIKEADLLIQVVNMSSPLYENHIKVTNEILEQLGAKDIPMIYLLNKTDLLNTLPFYPKENQIFTSLMDKEDSQMVMDFILSNICKGWIKKEVLFPYSNNFSSFLKDNYVIKYVQQDDGYFCTVYFNPLTLSEYKYLFTS